MSFCDFFPDDPSCAPVPEDEEEVVVVDDDDEEGVDEPVDDVEDEDQEPEERRMMGSPFQEAMRLQNLAKWASYNPTGAQVAFLAVAVACATRHGLDAFRYHAVDKFYDGFKVGDKTQWYKLTQQIVDYGGLAIAGTAAIFQLLSTLGIMSGLNLMIWTYVVGFGGLALMSTVYILRKIGYDSYYSDAKSTTATISTPAQAALGAISEALLMDTAVQAAMDTILMVYGEDWLWAQWDNATPEEQDAWVEEWELAVAEKEKAWFTREEEEAMEKAEEEMEAEEEEAADEEEEQ